MTRVHIKTYQRERQAFCIAVSLFFILAVLYIYFVSAAVAHVVVRKELDQDITAMHTRISELESAYVIGKDAIGEAQALTQGFEKNEVKIFVEKKSSVAFSSNESF